MADPSRNLPSCPVCIYQGQTLCYEHDTTGRARCARDGCGHWIVDHRISSPGGSCMGRGCSCEGPVLQAVKPSDPGLVLTGQDLSMVAQPAPPAFVPFPATAARESDCEWCKLGRGGPTHRGSSRCRSGSLAAGGTRAHCSCDSCY